MVSDCPKTYYPTADVPPPGSGGKPPQRTFPAARRRRDHMPYEMKIEQSVINRINTLKDLPSLPHILVKLVAACNDENESLREIVGILTNDPSLCSKVLKLVNSAYYSLGRRIDGIDQAVAYLGTRTIKNIAICSAVYQTFNTEPEGDAFNLKTFWWHSLKCALLSRIFTRETGSAGPEEAFVAGLLHDIGKLVLWVNFDKKRADDAGKTADRSQFIEAAENQLGASHSQIGAWLLDRWKFHSLLADAALYHHEPMDRIVHALPLTKVVYVADKLAGNTEDSHADGMRMANLLYGFSREQVFAFLARSEEEIGEVARSFGIEIEAPESSESNPSESDRAAQVNMVRTTLDLSLLLGTLRDLASARHEAEIFKFLRDGLQILFDLRQVCFFHYDAEKDLLIGRKDDRDRRTGGGQDLIIPLSSKDSLLVDCLSRGEISDTFSGDRPVLVLADEQIVRYLGSEGMLCLPLRAGGRNIGVIAAGLDQIGVSDIGDRLGLLEMFADEAALALRAEQLRQKQLERIQAERAEASFALARKIVHEVNNPLGIMKNYLKLLAIKLKNQNIAQDEIGILNEEIDRVSALLGGMTALSESNSHPAAPVDLNALIGDLLKLTQESMMAEKKVLVHTDLDPELPALKSDGDRLKQILINLMKNAVEAMEAGGNLFLTTRYRSTSSEAAGSGGYVEVSVCDDGPGISDEMQRKLFEPFETSKGSGHAGLGLSIVLNLIKNLNGSIVCESEVGNGTCFKIELPPSGD